MSAPTRVMTRVLVVLAAARGGRAGGARHGARAGRSRRPGSWVSGHRARAGGRRDAEWADGRRRIDSLVTIEAEQYLKGDFGERVTFRVPGGRIGRYRSVMVGAAVVRRRR